MLKHTQVCIKGWRDTLFFMLRFGREPVRIIGAGFITPDWQEQPPLCDVGKFSPAQRKQCWEKDIYFYPSVSRRVPALKTTFIILLWSECLTQTCTNKNTDPKCTRTLKSHLKIFEFQCIRYEISTQVSFILKRHRESTLYKLNISQKEVCYRF